MKREKGSIGDFMAVCICMLAMAAVLLSYMDNIRLVDEKTQISQIARKYILKMESTGMLTAGDREALCRELEAVGAAEVDLNGTTMEAVGYGEAIALVIRGRLRESYDFEEKRVSTAKH